MNHRYSKYILGTVTILCALLIVASSIRESAFNPVRSSLGYVLVPFERGLTVVGDTLSGIADNTVFLTRKVQENDALRQEIDTLIEENNRLKSETLELERLRSLYDLDQDYLQYPKVAARVISKDAGQWFRIFRIDKGSADGIEPDMNVLSGGGLLGIVTDVGSNYATVRAIIDDESRVYAMSQSSADSCIVAGDLTLFEEGRLKLTNIDKNAGISDGDAIVTSNISTKFLPGILIGYASGVEVDERQLTKSGQLIPVADFENLQEVLVITMTKADLTDLSAEGNAS